ncbi:hypothetical protein [Halalkalicoccus jeotgali]|uniref:Uncharacterized protein n=1 Tax=Halalkalicoccus jeotgali (strain DSM 18796 / CECT 7217 / JCM 14584 / KCTC 4019 / B3) TaxID=795797 RepID=D8J9U1_HALJB|nr:hypothetical protein [Halalkalicoccus jeotgali]ADJ14463.1 hypothetical protein HacjB3_05360 [Halalkalicoccus jeotgali B3]ELY40177.1 hypothetical protein C497_03735 [Halalkalicoccus jeotgali B3]
MRDVYNSYDEASDSYGEAMGFDHVSGDFRRDARNRVRVLRGPQMVAEQLVRTLLTPCEDRYDEDFHRASGTDPFRPEYGLDRSKLLGTSEALAKEAIIEAIGPDADSRVARLAPGDIELDRTAGNRDDVEVHITVYLADGTPVEFATQLRGRMTRDGFQSGRERSTERLGGAQL